MQTNKPDNVIFIARVKKLLFFISFLEIMGVVQKFSVLPTNMYFLLIYLVIHVGM